MKITVSEYIAFVEEVLKYWLDANTDPKAWVRHLINEHAWIFDRDATAASYLKANRTYIGRHRHFEYCLWNDLYEAFAKKFAECKDCGTINHKEHKACSECGSSRLVKLNKSVIPYLQDAYDIEEVIDGLSEGELRSVMEKAFPAFREECAEDIEEAESEAKRILNGLATSKDPDEIIQMAEGASSLEYFAGYIVLDYMDFVRDRVKMDPAIVESVQEHGIEETFGGCMANAFRW